MRNVLHVKGAHKPLSQTQLMDWGLRIVPVNGYGIKIFDKSPTDSARGRGRGNFVGVSHPIGGLFWVDVKFAEKRHRERE